MEKIFFDENKSWQFDFSSSVWAIDKLHEIYSAVKDSLLSDVDFIVENQHELLLIECKNANFKGVNNPKDFTPIKKDSINKLARKYYDSLHFINGIGKNNGIKLTYVYVVESYTGNITERKGIRNRLKDRLPFKLQRDNSFQNKLITDIKVLNLDEWNDCFPQFPATRLQYKLRDT
jgi:hypothetical protein